MNAAIRTSTTKSLIAAGLLCIASSSMAQWQWLDRSGRKVFSDRPPPADISEKNIIKRPGAAPVTVINDTETGAAAPAESSLAASAVCTPAPCQRTKRKGSGRIGRNSRKKPPDAKPKTEKWPNCEQKTASEPKRHNTQDRGSSVYRRCQGRTVDHG